MFIHNCYPSSMPSFSSSALRALRQLTDPAKAAFFPRFFKTGKGEYGEGDRFLGITVPQVRAVAKMYAELPLSDVAQLLQSPYHEARLLALLILVRQYESAEHERTKKGIVDFYLRHKDRVNNWDLVDVSAYKILGEFLLTRDRSVLLRLAKSFDLWSQRIAIVATFSFIREGQFDDTLKLAEIFLTHTHDLMHKATGWMLREVGKRDLIVLRTFLDQYAARMPRTMLRYAIEKMTVSERKKYLRT